MHKVLVAEIGSETTIVNAFGDLNTEDPLLLGQGLSPTTELEGYVEIGLRGAITDLENDIGTVGPIGEIPFYISSSLPTWSTIQGGNEQYTLDAPGMQEVLQIVNDRILTTPGAIMQATQLIYEEVGDVLVLHVGSASTDVYSVTMNTNKHQKSDHKSKPLALRTVEKDLGIFTSALTLVKLIGENTIKEHHGQEWKKSLKYRPETPEEIALSAELIAAAVKIALQRHIRQPCNYNATSGEVTNDEGLDLTRIRWIVGTGVALTQLPNGLKIMTESIKEITDALFPQEGIAMLLDKNCIMVSLGVLSTNYRQGAWQLLSESFGVEN